MQNFCSFLFFLFLCFCFGFCARLRGLGVGDGLARATTWATREVEGLDRDRGPVVVDLELRIRHNGQVNRGDSGPAGIRAVLRLRSVVNGDHTGDGNRICLEVTRDAEDLRLRVVDHRPEGGEATGRGRDQKRLVVLNVSHLLLTAQLAEDEHVVGAGIGERDVVLALHLAEAEDGDVLAEGKVNGVHLERKIGLVGRKGAKCGIVCYCC